MKNKIAIIVPYFGRFQEWFDMYLYSCSKNSYGVVLPDCALAELLSKIIEKLKSFNGKNHFSKILL